MAEPVGALRVDVSANSAQIESDLRRIGGIVNSASAQMARGMAGFAGGASRAIAEVLSLKTALVGLAAGALVAAEKKAIDFGDNIAKTAAKIGISTDSLQELRYGAQQAGTSSEDLDNILLQLSKRLGGAQNNVDETAKALGRLGIDIKSVSGLKADQVFALISDRIRAVKDPMQQARIATDLFGKAGQQILPFLRTGSDGIAKVALEAHNLGIVLSRETLQGAEDANDEFTKIGAALKSAGVQMAAEFLPVLKEFRQVVTSPDFQNGMKSLAATTKSWIDYMIQHKAEVLAVAGALAGFKIGRAFGPSGAAIGAALGGVAGYIEGASKDADTLQGKIAAINARIKELDYAKSFNEVLQSNGAGDPEKLVEIERERVDLVRQRADLEKQATEISGAALASGQAIADHMVATLKAGGANLSQIAAVLATVKSESNFNPNATGDNGSAFGLFQWRGPRLDALKQYASQMGTSIDDVRTQLAFWVKEMGGTEAAAAAMWKAAGDPAQAAAAMAAFERFAGSQDKSSAEYQKRLALTQQYLQQLQQGGGITDSAINRVTISKPAATFDPEVSKALDDVAFKTRVARGEFSQLADGFPELVNGFELSRGAVQGFSGDVSKLPPQLQQLNQAMQQLDQAKRLQSAAHDLAGAFEGAFENAIFSGQSLRQVLASLAQDIAKIFIKLALLKPLENSFTSLLGGLGGSTGGLFGGLALPGFANGGSFEVGGSGGIDRQLVAFRATPRERVDISTPSQRREAPAASGPVSVDNRTRIINAFDSVDFLAQALGSSAGERVLLNFVRANPGSFRSALGTA